MLKSVKSVKVIKSANKGKENSLKSIDKENKENYYINCKGKRQAPSHPIIINDEYGDEEQVKKLKINCGKPNSLSESSQDSNIVGASNYFDSEESNFLTHVVQCLMQSEKIQDVDELKEHDEDQDEELCENEILVEQSLNAPEIKLLSSSQQIKQNGSDPSNLIKIEHNSNSNSLSLYQTFGALNLMSSHNSGLTNNNNNTNNTNKELSQADSNLIITNTKINNADQIQLLNRIIQNLHQSNNNPNKLTLIPPYDQIDFDDFSLIDFYLKDFVKIRRGRKKVLTGKKYSNSNSNSNDNNNNEVNSKRIIPPLPTEVLDRYKKGHKNFDLKMHHYCIPSKATNNFGYGFTVKCSKLEIDYHYIVSDRKVLPASLLREYLAQFVLRKLFPNVNRWVELIQKLNFKL